MPGVQRPLQRRALALYREVHDRRRAAPGGRPGAGLEIVGGERAAERHLKVGVHVDAARQDVPAGRVQRPVGRGGQGAGVRGIEERGDGLAVDEHVGCDGPGGSDNRATADEGAHVTSCYGWTSGP
jgi:hypothetical protein